MKNFLLLVTPLFLFTAFIYYLNLEDNSISSVILGGKAYQVKILDTDVLRQKGLSGQALLLDNQGMLFVFSKPNTYGFWMKEMHFPIDIIWIDEKFRIVHLEKAVSPETYPKVFYPSAPALYVLEISAGESERLNLQIGDLVKFIKK